MNLAFAILLVLILAATFGVGIKLWIAAFVMGQESLVPRSIVMISIAGIVITSISIGRSIRK